MVSPRTCRHTWRRRGIEVLVMDGFVVKGGEGGGLLVTFQACRMRITARVRSCSRIGGPKIDGRDASFASPPLPKWQRTRAYNTGLRSRTDTLVPLNTTGWSSRA